MAAVPSRGRATGVEESAAPEADATRALYERYGNQIFGYCLHQLGTREEAEDALQSTFLNAFRGLRRGVVPEAEQAWLFKIAQNVCLSRRRSSWRRGRIESPADFELAEETAAAPARRADELIGLQDVLESMPESQRRAILLREWQGLSYREIAAELELSQAAVETLIFRARRSLAQGLETSPVEQRSWRERLRPTLNLSGLLGWLQSFLAGGVAVKAAGTVAVVAVTSAVVATPAHHGVAPTQASPARHATRAAAPVWSPPPLVLRAAAAWTHARPASQSSRPYGIAPVSSAPVQVPPAQVAPAPASSGASAPAAATAPDGATQPSLAAPPAGGSDQAPPAHGGPGQRSAGSANPGSDNSGPGSSGHANPGHDTNQGHDGAGAAQGHGQGAGAPGRGNAHGDHSAPGDQQPAPQGQAGGGAEPQPQPSANEPQQGQPQGSGDGHGNGNGHGNGQQNIVSSALPLPAPPVPVSAPPVPGDGHADGNGGHGH